MDLDTIAKSAGIALALSVAANIALWRLVMRLLEDRMGDMKTVGDLTGALKDHDRLVESLARDREG